jgi:hypothetical protein
VDEHIDEMLIRIKPEGIDNLPCLRWRRNESGLEQKAETRASLIDRATRWCGKCASSNSRRTESTKCKIVKGVFGRRRPDGKCDPSPRVNDSMSLTESLQRESEMLDAKIDDHCIKCAVREWESLGVGLPKLAFRMKPVCLGNHVYRKIDADDYCATLCGR